MTLDNAQLEVIRKRTEAATEGPWKWEGDKFGDIVVYSPVNRGFHNNGGEIAEMDCGSRLDAEFIAHARSDVPALLAEIERLHSYYYEKLGEQMAETISATQIIEKIDSENKQLRKTLEFYASEHAWQNGVYETVEGDRYPDAPPIIYDGGDKARRALNGGDSR